MYCKHCGFELQEKVNYCPACGKSQLDPVEQEQAPQQADPVVTPPAQAAAQAPYNTCSIVGFALSCASFVLTFLGLTALAGLICSIIGLRQTAAKGERGKGYAVAGIIVAILSLITFAFAIATLSQILLSGEFEQLFSFT